MTAPSISHARSSACHVIALHCSGGSGRQWRKLAERLGPDHHVIAPDLPGAGGGGTWDGDAHFGLADAARGIIALIDLLDSPVHLVGHSYGGGLALHVAAQRPARIASLCVFEPSAFHVLAGTGSDGQAALDEIAGLARAMQDSLRDGSHREAAALFVDYWNDAGTFAAMTPEQQARLIGFLPRAALDFRALIREPTPMSHYAGFGFPILILRGEHAPAPTRLIADGLASNIPTATVEIVAGAGHMGPVTHADVVADRMARHIHGAGRKTTTMAA